MERVSRPCAHEYAMHGHDCKPKVCLANEETKGIIPFIIYAIMASMIPLEKLAKLPGSLRLRKAANLVRGAERRLVVSGRIPPDEAEYLGKLMELDRKSVV